MDDSEVSEVERPSESQMRNIIISRSSLDKSMIIYVNRLKIMPKSNSANTFKFQSLLAQLHIPLLPNSSIRKASFDHVFSTNLGLKFLLPVSLPFGLFHGETTFRLRAWGMFASSPNVDIYVLCLKWFCLCNMIFYMDFEVCYLI